MSQRCELDSHRKEARPQVVFTNDPLPGIGLYQIGRRDGNSSFQVPLGTDKRQISLKHLRQIAIQATACACNLACAWSEGSVIKRNPELSRGTLRGLRPDYKQIAHNTSREVYDI